MRRRFRALALVVAPLGALQGCGGEVILGGVADAGVQETGSTTAGAGVACAAGGGKCVLGGASCTAQAPTSAQDCNPDRNPGGAFCCLSSTGGASATCSPVPAALDGGSSTAPDGGTRSPIVLTRIKAMMGNPVGLAGIAVDATHAYVASYEGGSVYAVPLEGGDAVALDGIGANNVAINSTSVFTVSYGYVGGVVAGCAKTGCNGVYQVLASGQTNVWGVAADEDNVYWTNQSTGGGPGVGKVPAAGGPVTALFSGTANDIVAGSGRVFFSGVPASSSIGDGLYSVPVDGGTPVALVPGIPDQSVVAIAVDCANVYFSRTDGIVARIPITGGAFTTLATMPSPGASSLQIAVDATRVYFGNGSGLFAVPIGGGPVQALATTTSISIGGIAVDANYVYWTDIGNAVMKVAK